MKEERDFFSSTPTLFKSLNFVFYWNGGSGGRRGGGECFVERDVTQEGSREQTCLSMIVVGSWDKKGNFSVT